MSEEEIDIQTSQQKMVEPQQKAYQQQHEKLKDVETPQQEMVELQQQASY